MFWQKKVTRREVVQCKACDGTGKRTPSRGGEYMYATESQLGRLIMATQGTCVSCEGRGTHQYVWDERA